MRTPLLLNFSIVQCRQTAGATPYQKVNKGQSPAHWRRANVAILLSQSSTLVSRRRRWTSGDPASACTEPLCAAFASENSFITFKYFIMLMSYSQSDQSPINAFSGQKPDAALSKKNSESSAQSGALASAALSYPYCRMRRSCICCSSSQSQSPASQAKALNCPP